MKDLVVDGNTLRNETLCWLETLKIGEGRYRVSTSGGDSLFTSCAAVFIRGLLDDLKHLTREQIKKWIEYLQGMQDSRTGYFSDHRMKKQGDFEGIWESEYVREEATMFCVMALSALGAEPLHKLIFLKQWNNTELLLGYVKKLDWREPWYQSNKVMFRLSLLVDDFERNGSPESRDSAVSLLDWLDSWQDPETGLWGTNKGASVYHGVFTAFHFMFFYFYLNREVHYADKLIDSALSIQNRKDGLFSPHGAGGACPDIDAVDILVKCSMVTDYRRDDIGKALGNAFQGLWKNRNKDDGFCWSRTRPFTPLEWIRSIPNILNETSRSRGLYTELIHIAKTHFTPRGYKIHYSGLDYLSYYSSESDIFSTWFRLLTMALIDARYPARFIKDLSWKFPQKAGLGWHSPAIGKY
jgi:hypothetical protein